MHVPDCAIHFLHYRTGFELLPWLCASLCCCTAYHADTGLHTCFRSAVKQKGRKKKGPPDIAPKSFSQKGPKWCSVLSIGVIGKSALEIGHVLRRNIWMISGGPFLSRPLCFIADINCFIADINLPCYVELFTLQNWHRIHYVIVSVAMAHWSLIGHRLGCRRGPFLSSQSCPLRMHGDLNQNGRSHRPLTLLLLKSIAIRLPFLSRYFCKSVPSSWSEVTCPPPIVSRHGAEALGPGVAGTPPRSNAQFRG